MKKQNTKNVRVVHSVSQKIWGGLALCALFVCGIMVGVGLVKKNVADTQMAQAEQQKQACAVVEEIQLGWLNDERSSNVAAHKENIMRIFVLPKEKRQTTYFARIVELLLKQ